MASSVTQDSQAYGMLSDRTRKRMVERLRQSGIQDERVLNAMSDVPLRLSIRHWQQSL
jgi:protein-L-isoaspartate(D-aspartate) O-methyltransferase